MFPPAPPESFGPPDETGADPSSPPGIGLGRGAGTKIHEGQQGKHIPGHNNFVPSLGRSEVHVPIESLLPRVGTGQPVKGTPGQPGYRERVDFGKPIGVHVDGPNGPRTPTTKGIIHHGKNGVHIIPARP